MAKILIVEDEKQMADFISLELKHEGYEVDICYDGKQGYENAINTNYDIILLDIMLPKINGMEVCRRLRIKKHTPIIMLTAKGDITDKVNGLDIGADDYLTKPFEIEELLARIRVILRRKSQAINQSKIIQVVDLKLDLEKKQVSRNDKNIELKVLSDSFDKMIERLEISFNKQNQFISDVSHELKTPISVIFGYANLLDRWGKDDIETCNKSIQAIKNETKNMNELVSKLLYITRADIGEVHLKKTKINVQELINEIIEETNLMENWRSRTWTCYRKINI